MEKGIDFFFNRYKQLNQSPKMIAPETTIRVNTNKISKQKLIERLEKKKVKIRKCRLKHCLFTQAKFSLGSTPEYLLGYYYKQSLPAQIPVQVLFEDNKPAVGILDMCAAPGGKTTQISQYTKKNIIALDIKPQRLDALKNNIERMGNNNITVLNMDAREANKLNLKFDKILLDAPCSGNFISDKNWFKKRTLSGIKKQAKLQKQLLESAYKVLKPGGILVYSTCSLEPEENELNINEFLNNHKDIQLEKIKLGLGDSGLTKVFNKQLNSSIKLCQRFWPWKTFTEGFFIAKLRKNERFH